MKRQPRIKFYKYVQIMKILILGDIYFSMKRRVKYDTNRVHTLDPFHIVVVVK